MWSSSSNYRTDAAALALRGDALCEPQHRMPHRVDMRAGDHDDVRGAAVEQRLDHARDYGLARTSDRKGRFGVAHSRRCAGRENDG